MITIQDDRDHLRSLNNRLQHKLKDINDEFRLRLSKYVQDIAVSAAHGGCQGSRTVHVQRFHNWRK